MKICSKCKVEKPFEEFSKNKIKKDGCQDQCKSCKKQYREENKDKMSEKKKRYYKENKDKICEQQKQYREENKDKISEKNKEYKKENKDKISEQQKQYREENKDKISEKNKEYAKLNPQKVNAKSAKRKAKKLQATPTWLTVEHFKSIERFYSISKEMELISGVKYHVDHIVPLQGDNVCGLHVPWNLQVIEASENLSKKNKLLSQDQEFYHQIPEFDDLMENICEKY